MGQSSHMDNGRLEKMVRMGYLMHNAIQCGAVASRPRQLGLEGAEVSKIPAVSYFNPVLCLTMDGISQSVQFHV